MITTDQVSGCADEEAAAFGLLAGSGSAAAAPALRRILTVRRIGMGQSQRAAKLGVDRATLKRWDEQEAATSNEVAAAGDAAGADAPAALGPTHQRLSTGRVESLRKERTKAPVPLGRRAERRAQVAAANKGHKTPHWFGQFVKWVRRPLPEDRDMLIRIRDEVDQAIRVLGVNH